VVALARLLASISSDSMRARMPLAAEMESGSIISGLLYAK
jgi:hypothetical protein